MIGSDQPDVSQGERGPVGEIERMLHCRRGRMGTPRHVDAQQAIRTIESGSSILIGVVP